MVLRFVWPVTQLALHASLYEAERATVEAVLDDRDLLLYVLIRRSGVPVTDDGESATFTREWVDETWLSTNRGYVPDESRYPGSVKQFGERFFAGLLHWRDTRRLTARGRSERRAAKALRDEWRQTGRMQLGQTLAEILRRSGRVAP